MRLTCRVSTRVETAPLYRAALLAPVQRVRGAPWPEDALAILATALWAALGAPFVWISALLLFATFGDWALGAEVARKEGRHDEHISRAGLIGKLAGVGMLLMLWGLEAIIVRVGLFDTHGALGMVAGVILVIHEGKSWDRKVEALTGKPSPLRPIFNLLQSLAEARLPSPKPQVPPAGDGGA